AASIDHEASDLLPASAASHMGLVGMDVKTLVGGDAADGSQERAQTGLALVALGEAEGEIVGIAGVSPAEAPGEAGEAAIEPEAEGVGERRAGGRALREAAGAERDVVLLALVLHDLAGSLGADQRHERGDLIAISGAAEDAFGAPEGHRGKEVLEI